MRLVHALKRHHKNIVNMNVNAQRDITGLTLVQGTNNCTAHAQNQILSHLEHVKQKNRLG